MFLECTKLGQEILDESFLSVNFFAERHNHLLSYIFNYLFKMTVYLASC